MHVTIALILSWIVLMVTGIASTLAAGQFDFYTMASLLLLHLSVP